MSRLRSILLALSAGVALFLAFPDVGWWWAAPLGIAACYLAVANSGFWGGFGLGWLTAMVFFLGHLWWAYVAVGPIPWIALSAAEAVAVGVACGGFAMIRRARVLAKWSVGEPIAFALLWVGAELLRSAWPFGGFPWGRIAFAVADAPLLRLAWLGGAPLVSFATVLIGAMLAQSLAMWKRRRPVPALALPLAAAVIIIAPLALPLDNEPQTGTLRVAWVQGNLANEGLDSFDRAREVTSNHRDATLDLMSSPSTGAVDLGIWPENASDIDPRSDSQTAAVVTQAAAALGAPLLLGTNDYTPVNGRYNLDLVWLPDGTQLQGQEYRKQVPAAFAEYIPMRSVARLFSSDVDRVTTDMIAGTDPARLEVPIARLGRTVTVGPVICFEVAYDWVPRQAARQGAEFIAVQTNNATFGVTPESTQQLAMSRLRAVETGKATLQVSTVGVSAVISPDGSVQDSAPLFTRAAGVATVPLRTSLTPATHWGGPIESGFDVAAALLFVWGAVKRPRKGRP